jgi:hypothetical protein
MFSKTFVRQWISATNHLQSSIITWHRQWTKNWYLWHETLTKEKHSMTRGLKIMLFSSICTLIHHWFQLPMILEHLFKKAPQGNKERSPLIKGLYPYGSNLMLDLSLAFPLPPFVKMCFQFFLWDLFNEERHKNKQIILVPSNANSPCHWKH